jgi:hypothetical protein
MYIEHPGRHFTRCLLSIACLLMAAATGGDIEPPPTRIAVIGASASAGFGVIEEIGTSDDAVRFKAVSLGDLIITAGRDQEIVVLDLASGSFFTRPERFGTASMKRVESWNPDLVVAIDFLFWFVYGSSGRTAETRADEDPRLTRLETGLALLAELKVPLIIGEIPDMSAAIGGMLSRAQVPSSATMKAANTRIHEWAAARPGTAVVPLFELTTMLRSGDAFTIGDVRWDPNADGLALILPDKLHPSLDGLVAMLQSAMVEAGRSPDIQERLPKLVLDRETLVDRVREVTPTPPATSEAP